MFVGLAKIKRTGPLATPRSGDEIAKDWMLIDLLHMATIEPANGSRPQQRRRQS